MRHIKGSNRVVRKSSKGNRIGSRQSMCAAPERMSLSVASITKGEPNGSQTLSHLRGNGCHVVPNTNVRGRGTGVRSGKGAQSWQGPDGHGHGYAHDHEYGHDHEIWARSWTWAPRALVSWSLVGLRRRPMLAMDPRRLDLDLWLLSTASITGWHCQPLIRFAV